MNSVSGVNFTGREQNTSKSRTLRHLDNMAVTVGGVAGTVYATKKAPKYMRKIVYNTAEGTKIINNFKVVNTKLGKSFEWLGNKIFNPNNKVFGKQLENLQKYLVDHKVLGVKDLSKAKSIGALLLVGSAVALGFIVRGIYNAGKINGDKQ